MKIDFKAWDIPETSRAPHSIGGRKPPHKSGRGMKLKSQTSCPRKCRCLSPHRSEPTDRTSNWFPRYYPIELSTEIGRSSATSNPKRNSNSNIYIKYSTQTSFYALIRVTMCPYHLHIDKKESRVPNLRLRLKVWSTKLDRYRQNSVERYSPLIISFCPMNKRIPFDWPSTMESWYKKYPVAFQVTFWRNARYRKNRSSYCL
jgi:hypothetical protein